MGNRQDICMLVHPMFQMHMLCNAFSMLMIYVIKVARYACGDDAHVLTNKFLMPCNHVLIHFFVSKHKEG
jgi:hypothetical protein